MTSPRPSTSSKTSSIEQGSPKHRRAPGQPTRVALALGSNLGDSSTLIDRALAFVRAAAIPDLKRASLYRTEAELLPGAQEQPLYINTAAVGRTTLEPDELLAVLKRIEQICGRSPSERWAARPIDIDLLLYGTRVEHRPELTLPHPRLSQRAFYLVPLAEIAPGQIVPPDGHSVSELLDALCRETAPDEGLAPEKIKF